MAKDVEGGQYDFHNEIFASLRLMSFSRLKMALVRSIKFTGVLVVVVMICGVIAHFLNLAIFQPRPVGLCLNCIVVFSFLFVVDIFSQVLPKQISVSDRMIWIRQGATRWTWKMEAIASINFEIHNDLAQITVLPSGGPPHQLFLSNCIGEAVDSLKDWGYTVSVSELRR